MTSRLLAIATRKHPVALGCYVGMILLALGYLVGISASFAIEDATSPTVATIWQIALLSGGMLALTGALLPPLQLPRGLALEALGAAVIAIELGTYSVVLAFGLDSVPWASVVVFGAVAVGCAARAFDAWQDRESVMEFALAAKEKDLAE